MAACLTFHEHLVLEDCEALITDLVMGDDLFSFRDKGLKPKLSEVEGRNILYKVIEAMAEYHETGIVHRDLHSMNIMIHFDDLKPTQEDLE